MTKLRCVLGVVVVVLLACGGLTMATPLATAEPAAGGQAQVTSSAGYFTLSVTGPYVNGQPRDWVHPGEEVTYFYRVRNVTEGSFTNWARVMTWSDESPIKDSHCAPVKIDTIQTEGQIGSGEVATFSCKTRAKQTHVSSITANFDTYWDNFLGTWSEPDTATVALNTQVRPRETDLRKPTPIECAGTGVYIGRQPSREEGLPRFTQLYLQYVEPNGRATFQPVGSTDHHWQYNAMAFNPEDNLIYAVSSRRSGIDHIYGSDSPRGHLLQVDANGNVFDLGEIEGLPAQDVSSGVTSGSFVRDATGELEYVVSNSSRAGTRHLYVVDLKTREAKVLKFNDKFVTNDFAVLRDSYGNALPYLWGMRNPSDESKEPVLMRFDLAQGVIKEIRVPEMVHQIYGSAWTFGNGNLGFAGNGPRGSKTANWYQLAVDNPASANPRVQIISGGLVGTSLNNDGTSCVPRQPPNGSVVPADLRVTKSALPPTVANGVVTHRWAVVVRNEGPADSSGAVITEQIPAGLTNVRVPLGASQCGLAGPDDVYDPRRGPLKCTIGYLNNHGYSSLVIQGESRDTRTCVTNQASVYGNEADHNEGNNSASAVSCPPSLEVTKRAVNADGRGPARAVERGEDGLWHAYYVISVRNKGVHETTYGKLDEKPAPGAGLEVRSVRWRQGAQAWQEATRRPGGGEPVWQIGDALAAVKPAQTDEYQVDVALGLPEGVEFDTSTATCTNRPGAGAFNAITSAFEAPDAHENNSACVNVTPPPVVPKNPRLTMVKHVDGGGPFERGDQWQLTYQAGNARQTLSLSAAADNAAQGVSQTVELPQTMPLLSLTENGAEAKQRGYEPQPWVCENLAARPPLSRTVPVNAAGAGTGWILGSTIPASADLRCEITNVYKPAPKVGKVTWTKVDSTSQRPIGGASFELRPTDPVNGRTPIVVTDCVKMPCQAADKDPLPGKFMVDEVAEGGWSLVETAAPAGYRISPIQRPVGVPAGGTAQPVTGPNVPNDPVDLPALPLTGGLGSDWVRLGGGALLLIGGAAVAVTAARSRKRS